MKDKVYFPGLNGLRFFAALSVIFYHLGISDYFGAARRRFFLSNLVFEGNDAVTLFFVLSGFLITYLLLVELKNTETIHVRKFYARRMLRIWPLYYFMVFLGFVVFPLLEQATGYISPRSLTLLPADQVLQKLGVYLVMLPQVSSYFGHTVVSIEHLWTIGTEETFYLMWPVLVLVFRKHILALLLGVIGVKLACHLIYAVLAGTGGAPEWLLSGLGLVNFIRVENMAVGGLGAYILFTNRERILRVVFHPAVEKGVLLVVAANILWFTGSTNVVIHELLSVVYIMLILNIACNPRATLKLEHPVLNHLGRISYGIYMYHAFLIAVIGVLFSRAIFLPNDSFALTVGLYVGVTALTIGVAHLSYTYFEQPFLRMKRRFTVVNSGLPEGDLPHPLAPSPLAGRGEFNTPVGDAYRE